MTDLLPYALPAAAGLLALLLAMSGSTGTWSALGRNVANGRKGDADR